jgi:hypothetical protein
LTRWTYLLAVPLTLGPLAPPTALSQQAPPAQTQPAAPEFTQAELEQILAPIALYPDDLLTQVLAAATYPLEVVMASRWVEQPANKALKNDALLKALDGQDWDASVKSLVPFPAVLKTMSDQLDWTQKLGDAFLAQPSDVFAAVQTLRGRAQGAGKLQSNAQQTVRQDGPAIVIQPTQTETVYVPAYNPTVVYGAWPYPANPPVYYPPPVGYYAGTALATGLAFGAGIAITGALWGWGSPNWGGGNINVNTNRYNNINANRYNNFSSRNGSISSGTWQHNADHRRGVGYTNSQVRQQYRPNAGAGNAASRDAFRGRGTAGQAGLAQGGQRLAGNNNLQGNRPNGGAGAANRPANVQRPNGGGGLGAQNRPQNTQRPNGGGNAAGRSQGAQRQGGGGSAFKGVGNGAATRAQSAQGSASRGGAQRAGGRGGGGGGARAGGGGGARAGGGGRGGGGGGGRGGRR